jgi:hypothetical protein
LCNTNLITRAAPVVKVLQAPHVFAGDWRAYPLASANPWLGLLAWVAF